MRSARLCVFCVFKFTCYPCARTEFPSSGGGILLKENIVYAAADIKFEAVKWQPFQAFAKFPHHCMCKENLHMM